MAATNIQRLGTALEFDTAQYAGASHVWYDSDTFILVYSGAANDGYIEAFNIASDGTITSAGARLEFDTTQGNDPCIEQVDSTHYIVWWQGTDGDGFVQVMTLNTGDWTFTKEGSPLEFDITSYVDGSSQPVDSTHFLLAWAGEGTDGYAQIFSVNTSTWAVTAEGTPFEHDTTRGDVNSLVKLDTTHYLLCYSGAGSDGFAQVLLVNTSTWAVTETGTALEFDTTVAEHISAAVLSSTHVFVAWRGSTGIGQAQVLAVSNSTWNVTAAGAVFTFESTSTFGSGNSVFLLRDNIFVNAWTGADSDGFIQAFEVNLSTFDITAYGDRLEFDGTAGNNNHAFKQTNSRIVNVWGGEGTDGYTQAFDMVTVLARDEFTRADGALGANWTNQLGAFDVTSNKAEADSLGVTPFAISSWNGTFNSDGADYWVTADVVAVASSTGAGILARLTASDTYYYLIVSTFDQTLYMGKNIGGSFTDLDTFVGGYTAGTTYNLCLSVIGDEIKGYLNGVLLCEATDSAISSMGRPAIWADATSNTADNFLCEGYEAVAPPAGGAIIDFVGHGFIPFPR